MSIVFDFEDINRRMNRKPEVAAKAEGWLEPVKSISERVREATLLMQQYAEAKGLQVNNALVERLRNQNQNVPWLMGGPGSGGLDSAVLGGHIADTIVYYNYAMQREMAAKVDID